MGGVLRFAKSDLELVAVKLQRDRLREDPTLSLLLWNHHLARELDLHFAAGMHREAILPRSLGEEFAAPVHREVRRGNARIGRIFFPVKCNRLIEAAERVFGTVRVGGNQAGQVRLLLFVLVLRANRASSEREGYKNKN